MSAIPDARQYQPGTPGWFDWRMEQRIATACKMPNHKPAMNMVEWEEILDILCRANRNNNLRSAVRDLFKEKCPSKWMTAHLAAVATDAPKPVTPNKVVTGFCPICHQERLLKQVEPQYPDDPMVEETDFFVLLEHNDLQGRKCDGEGKNPTAMGEDPGFDFDPNNDQWGSYIDPDDIDDRAEARFPDVGSHWARPGER